MKRRNITKNKPLVEVIEELKTSGKWTAPSGCVEVDAFLVGGGGGGSVYYNSTIQPTMDGNGGGGGYTKTFYGIPVSPGATYNYTIGSGGNGGSSANGNDGGYTQFINSSYRANGGKGAKTNTDGGFGGDGGSGGGAGGGNGGSNGSDGTAKTSGSEGPYNSVAGKGQGSTTKCPFAGYSNTLFSGGGASAGHQRGYGSPGDDTGGNCTNNNSYPGGRVVGETNRGGGGGGAWATTLGKYNISGGSGIIILRYKKHK